MLEASLLAALGPAPAMALAPQAGAVAPLGVFHDLRWLAVYSRSWAGFALEGTALLAGRTVLTALSVRAAWPSGKGRPALGRCVVRAGLFSLAAGSLLSPFAVALFGLAVVPVSWLWFAAVPGALIVAALFHHGAIAPGWWRQRVSVRAIGWILAAFGLASAFGGIIDSVPVPGGLLVAGLAGLADAWTWQGLVGAVVGLGSDRRVRPVAPGGLIGFAAIVCGGTTLGFAVATPATPRSSGAEVVPASTAARAVPGGIAVLVAPGYGTSWDGRSPASLAGRYPQRRFSYRGLGPSDLPLAYTGLDTDQPLVDLERLMAAQVEALHRATREPVAIVAESEGSLVAKAYLAASASSPVRYLVMTSPLVQPGRVSYPATGRPGWGLAGGEGLRVIADAVGGVSPIPLSPGGPFLRSIVTESALLGPLLSCPLAGVTQAAILPLADAVGSPRARLDMPSMVITAFHGALLANPQADAAIQAVLRGRGLPKTPLGSLAEHLARAAGSAWQAPSLALSGRPGLPCPTIQAALALQFAR